MASYTIELRDIVENGRNIFPHPYPWTGTDEERIKFERDFIRHFYFREIGVETVDKFIFLLDDKMQTIFPYFNKLFEAAKIDYAILDNYKLTETTITERENKNRSSGVTSNVGRVMDDQQTETTGSMTGTGNSTQTENGNSETIHTGTSETTGTETETSSTSGTSETTENGTSTTTETDVSETTTSETTKTTGTTSETVTKNGDSNTTENSTNEKKYSDTPQGNVNIASSNYLTNITYDDGYNTSKTVNEESSTSSGSSETESTVTGSSNTETSKTIEGSTSDSSSTETTGTGETNTVTNSNTTVQDTNTGETESTATGSTSVQQDSTGSTKFTGEQKTTNDGNTRTESEGSHREKMEVIRQGNIGVDADSDMIQKHIKLQQILTNIQKMFFDECEDLFMGVY